MKIKVILAVAAFIIVGIFVVGEKSVDADNVAQTLPFSQNWTTTTLISTDDNWSGVAGIEGYRGDGLVAGTAVDPQTIVATSAVLDVNANQTNPNTFATGGVTEFDTLANPTVALSGSGTADAPYIVFYLNTTGLSSINVSYNLRDVDGSGDNSIQPVALQYRVGSTGDFVNVPAGFVADASSGPNLATLVTPVNVMLPSAVNNQALVQVRVITTDAAGSDEWIGVDDISVTGVVPTAANVSIGGRVATSGGSGIGRTTVTLYGGNLPSPIQVQTNAFGYYNFPAIPAGQTYVVSVTAKRYTFAQPTVIVTANDSISEMNFQALD